jgi:hypothetical protein
MDILEERCGSFQRRGARSSIAVLDDAAGRGKKPVHRKSHFVVEAWIERREVVRKLSNFVKDMPRVSLSVEVCKSRSL